MSDLPVSGTGQLICRYAFINPKLDQTLVSPVRPRRRHSHSIKKRSVRTFIQSTCYSSLSLSLSLKEYSFTLTDSFLATCRAGVLSIEVWFQASVIPRPLECKESRELRVLGQRWKDVKRHIQYSIEIQELNPTGQWCAVDVENPDGIICGGVYRLKQVSFPPIE